MALDQRLALSVAMALIASNVTAQSQTAYAKSLKAVEKLRYADSGNPLFAAEEHAAKSTTVHDLRRWRATAGSVVFETLSATPKGEDQAVGTLTRDDARLQGVGPGGHLRLFAPSEVDQGSSIAHWDSIAAPNLLMEPSINPSLEAFELDLTPQMMFDIGWTAGTASFRLFTNDPAGIGFNDRRPFAGAPGNDATTLGQARRNVFERALAAWGAVVESSVPIDVIVSYADLACGDDGTTLGGASSLFQFSNDSTGGMLPLDNIAYPGPLAEAIIGTDLTGPPGADGGDITVTINAAIDNGCRGDDRPFYYGLDGNEPPGHSDLLPVVLHEIGHGLGFQNFANLATGRPRSGLPSVYDLFTFDAEIGKHWADMTAAERRRSATNTGNVVWDGPRVTVALDATLRGTDILRIDGDPDINGDYDLAYGSIGSGPPVVDITGPLNCILDPSGDLFDGCEEAVNDLTGQVAMVRRGSCFFTTKASNAQAAGATGLVIVNNVGEEGVPPGGDTSIPLNIPVAGMGQSAGEAIIANTCSNASAVRRAMPMLEVDPTLACPGFYIGRADALAGEGRWNMSISLSAGRRLLQGGLNLGGGFEDETRPGFAAFNIANAAGEPQIVNVTLDVTKPDAMVYQFDIVRREGPNATVVFSGQESAPTAQFSQTLEPGFYSVRVFGVAGTGVAPSSFTLALATRFVDRPGGAFQGGVNVGGVMTEETEFGTSTGFGALCIDTAQTVTFETIDGPGTVESLSLKVLDRAREVVVEVP